MSGLIRAAYLGPPASFSHQAALNFFAQPSSRSSAPSSTDIPRPPPSPPPVELVPHSSFASIFAAVQESSPSSSPFPSSFSGDHTSTTYGVVPFENSSNGSVVQLLDLLADREGQYGDVKVCAEYYLRVRHCLLGHRTRPNPPAPSSLPPLASPGKGRSEETHVENAAGAFEGVEKLYTHPQAWGQCSKFLDQHFRGVERQNVSSTSRAAEMVAQEPGEEAVVGESRSSGRGKSAAIASRLAADVYRLDVLQEGIEDQGDNVTRFFVLRREGNADRKGHSVTEDEYIGVDTVDLRSWKSLISFTIDHGAPGALADALGIFRTHGFNLTSIDTRPSRVRPWHYIFFVECEQAKKVSDAADRAGMDGIMADLEGVAQSCRHLGRWRDGLDRTKT